MWPPLLTLWWYSQIVLWSHSVDINRWHLSYVYDTQMGFRAIPTDFREGCKISTNNTWALFMTHRWDLGVTNGFYGRGVKFQQITPGFNFYDPPVTHQDAVWPTVLEVVDLVELFAGLEIGQNWTLQFFRLISEISSETWRICFDLVWEIPEDGNFL